MGNTIWESLRQKGYNRRQFLQSCGVAAAVAGLEHTSVAQVAAAFEKKEKTGRPLDALPGVHRWQ